MHQHAVTAQCNRCKTLLSHSAATEQAAVSGALRLGWERLDLPWNVSILLCAWCARVASKREILQEIIRSATAQLPAEATAPLPEPPPEVTLG